MINEYQCSRCDPVGDNVTWPWITLQKTHCFHYDHAQASPVRTEQQKGKVTTNESLYTAVSVN